MFRYTQIQKTLQDFTKGPPRAGDLADLADLVFISENERAVFEAALTLGLTDAETRKDLYNKAISGNLTETQLEKMKEVQSRLKAEGYYEGNIDGIFGEEYTKAVVNLSSFENTMGINYTVYSNLMEGITEEIPVKVDLSEEWEILDAIKEMLKQSEAD